jgi:hypothetical protein
VGEVKGDGLKQMQNDVVCSPCNLVWNSGIPIRSRSQREQPEKKVTDFCILGNFLDPSLSPKNPKILKK